MTVGRLLVAGLVSVAAVACNVGEGGRICRAASGAEVCLVERGKGYRVEGRGFAPLDEVLFTVGGERPTAHLADASGGVPARGVVGLLPGPSPTTLTVEGASRSGMLVRLVFDLPASG